MPENRLQRCWTLFTIFLGLSTVTLGGGMAMLPMMRTEFVDKRRWMTDDEMVDTVAAMQSLPGIIASNMGVLIGHRIAGVPGAFAAVLGSILPPFISISLLASLFTYLRRYPLVQEVFRGVRAAISALILLAVLSLARQIFARDDRRRRALAGAVAALSFCILVFLPQVNAAWVIAAAAVFGLLCLRQRETDASPQAKDGLAQN